MQELVETFGINWKLLLIQGINFGLLMVLLWYLLYRPVLNMIDAGREKIASGVRNAEEASRKLSVAESEGSAIVGKASRDAEDIVATARVRAEEKEALLIKTAEERAASLLSEVKARAGEERRQVLASAEQDIARAAVLAAEKILKNS